MPNVSDMSGFVTAGEDVKDGDTIIFADGGTLHKYDDGRQVIQLNVTCPNGRTKMLSLNRTSANNLAEVYGHDTDEWMGRAAVVTIVKMNVRGTMKNVIYLYPSK